MPSELERVLAYITIAMPIVLALAHAFRFVAERLYSYALTTPSTDDDRVILRVLTVARWFDQIAIAIGTAASAGVLRRRTPPDDVVTQPETPTAKRGIR